MIREDKKLKKLVEITDQLNNKKILRNLIVVPNKERNNILSYYHNITGHKNYLILHEKIIKDGYYWNDITISCKEFIKKCDICFMKNKTTFLPPPSNQIICEEPKELYLIDITDIPHEFIEKKKQIIYIIYTRSFFKI